MPTKKKSKPDTLLVVAHPDDEVLFFSGLIMANSKNSWHIICVTDGNADGQGQMRMGQFERSCKLLKVNQCDMWNFPDVFSGRLEISELVSRLKELPKYKKVFTHGILGEYGHAHHQDVSFAVHTAFKDRSPVYSVAQNIYPDIKVSLSPKHFALKTKILWDVYSSEIQRFINFIPASTSEGFTKVSFEEVFTIYATLTSGGPLNDKAIKKYRWLISWINQGGGKLTSRPF